MKKDRCVTLYPSHAFFRCAVDLDKEEVHGTLETFETFGHIQGTEVTAEKFAKYSLGAKYKKI